MTVSGQINGQLTARTIITQAMRLIGVLSGTEQPTDDQAETALLQLNWMLKSWQADGMNLWRRAMDEMVVPANTQVLTLDPRVINVPEARWVQSTTFQRQLGVMQFNDYQSLPNKLATSSAGPTMFMFDKQRDEVYLWLWPIPTMASTIKYTAARVIDDVTDLAQTLDLPQEWMETAYYGLGDRLCETFGAALSDPATAQRVTLRAAQLYSKMLDFDRPDAIFFKPYGTSSAFWRR